MNDTQHRIAVIGAGTMGQGIAQVAATSGFPTTLFDIDGARVEGAVAGAKKFLAKSIEKGKAPAEAADALDANLGSATDLSEAVKGASVVVEAVPEDLALKVRVLGEAAETVDAACVLASNTSSLSISKLAAELPNPSRVIGMHFFNPVPIMKLIEVVKGDATDDAVVDSIVDLSRRLTKEPIVVRDLPGFATSRLGVVLGLEACRMLEDGVASVEDIDRAMELGYRHPMGPLKLTDLVGLDVRLAIAEHLHRELGEQFRPPELLRRKVADGELGKKVGRGFYDYS